MVASNPHALADDAQVASHNNLSSEHALVGCTAMSSNLGDIWNLHFNNTSYEGFNAAYGDAHVGWTNTPDDFYDFPKAILTSQFNVYGESWFYWWK